MRYLIEDANKLRHLLTINHPSTSCYYCLGYSSKTVVRMCSSNLSDKEHKILRKRRALQKRAEAKLEEVSVKWSTNMKEALTRIKPEKKEVASTDLLKEVENTFQNLKSKFSPATAELGWEKLWEGCESEEKSDWRLDDDQLDMGEKFTMLMPPPNVTGHLHMGHALDCALQDSVARYQRMMGKEVRWIPGCDHAGIASQIVAERTLNSQGHTKNSIGRDNFLKYMHNFAAESSKTIRGQIKRLGANVSSTHYTYTMSAEYCDAVSEAFYQLFNQGFIKRQPDLVRWSPTLKSVISDSEIRMVEVGPGRNKFRERGKEIESDLFGLMFHIKYETSNGETITVATSRPETMFADVALCVNPNDSRYSHLIGQYATNPVNEQKLMIFADDKIQPDFGTGVMKLTPSHNNMDLEICERLGIKTSGDQRIGMYDKECKLNKSCGSFEGLNRFAARDRVVEMLKSKGLITQVEERVSLLPFCERSGDLLEFVFLDQWFLNIKTLADKWSEVMKSVLAVDDSGNLVKAIESKRHYNWCLSRQIWWGHQIPAYRVVINDMEQGFVCERDEARAVEEAVATYNCHPDDVTVEREQDVLDTWFSSAIYPLAALGWPNRPIEDIVQSGRYPTDLLVTGNDIVKPWVMRMLLLCTELTNGVIPFKSVYLHGLVLDPFGRKMSKSLGNVIDPLQVINGVTASKFRQDMQSKIDSGQMSNFETEYFNKFTDNIFGTNGRGRGGGAGGGSIPACGADCLRMMLLRQNNRNAASIKLQISSIKTSLEFCNKLKNVTSFIFLISKDKGPILPSYDNLEQFYPQTISAMDEFILQRLFELQSTSLHLYQSMQFSQLIENLESFLRKDFSNTYLIYLQAAIKDPEIKHSSYCTAVYVLSQFIKLCHPIVPFITEKLFQQLKYVTQPRNKNIFELKTILDESILTQRSLENCTTSELSENSGIGSQFMLDVITDVGDLVDEVTSAVNKRLSNREKCENGAKPTLQVLVPNYPLLTKSIQVYFKRKLQLNIHTVDVMISENDELAVNKQSRHKTSSMPSPSTEELSCQSLFNVETNKLKLICKLL